MDFDLTSEQRAIKRLCRGFAEREIEPFVRENLDTQWEGTQEERFPAEIYEEADEVGIRTQYVPERYDGDDFEPDVVTTCLMLEELCTPDTPSPRRCSRTGSSARCSSTTPSTSSTSGSRGSSRTPTS